MAQYDPRVEMCFDKGPDPANPAGWVWTDITDTIVGPVDISAGRQDESGRATESSIRFSAINDDGRYTPGLATSPYYELLDLGTPVRVTETTLLNQSRLYFGSTENTGYSATPDHASLDITGDIDLRADLEPYSWYGSSAQNDPIRMQVFGKWNPTSNQKSYALNIFYDGTLELYWSTDGSTRLSARSTAPMPIKHGRMSVRATLDVNNGAGGYTAAFYTSDSVEGTWTQLGSSVVGAGTTSIFSGTAALTVSAVEGTFPYEFANNALFDGRVYRLQVRNGIGGTVVANPDYTTLRGISDAFVDSTGKVWGILQTPNTFIEDPATRAWGYVSSIEPEWPAGDIEDLHGGSGGHSMVTFSAAGIFKRLDQANQPIQSVMTRSTVRTNPLPKAYWPLEDGKDSVKFASALPGQQPMYIRDLGFYADPKVPAPASYEGFVSSAPALVPNSAAIVADVDAVVGTSEVRVTALFYIPSDGLTDVEPSGIVRLFDVECDGTAGYWTFDVRASDGFVSIAAYTARGGSSLYSSGFVSMSGFGLLGLKGFLSLRLFQNGANIDWQLAFFPEGANLGYISGGTLSSRTFGRVFRLTYNGQATFSGGGAIGHVSVYDSDTLNVIWQIAQQVLNGYLGEPAGERFARLCTEEGIAYRIYGDEPDTEPMGYQPIDTLTNVLEECAAADNGLLYETKNTDGLTFRTRKDMYDQRPIVLDAGSQFGDIVNPFSPVKDDQNVVNDATASQSNGGSYRDTDDVDIAKRGRYSEELKVNVASSQQLPDLAGEMLRRGTETGMRYPQVSPAADVSPGVFARYGVLNLGDKIRVENLPKQHPSDAVEMLVQGYADNVIPYSYQITANTSNAGPWNPAEFAEPWNSDPDAPVRADSDSSALYASATSSGTSLSVRTLDGPPWVRYDLSPVDFPFDIGIKGEQIRVTSVLDAFYDDYNRTASSGWGTAPNGQTYTVSGGTTADFSVSSGTAKIRVADATRTQWRTAVAGPNVDQPEFYGRVLAPAVATTDIYAAGIILGTAASHYKFCLLFNTNGTVDAFLSDEGNILAGTSPYATGLGYTTNTWFNIKGRVYNGELGMKVWKDGSTEPSTWQLHTQNTSRSSTGPLGFTAVRQATNSNTNLTLEFDDLRLSSHQTFSVTRSVNGVSKSHSSGESVSLWTPPYLAR